MPVRTAALALVLALAAHLTAAASCPPADGRDAPACDATNASRITVALCTADARTTETCADHAIGLPRATYLTRAASEWRKAALAEGRRTAQGRRWLAHATVLDERVQDDPDASQQLRARAKHDEALARAALVRTNKPS